MRNFIDAAKADKRYAGNGTGNVAVLSNLTTRPRTVLDVKKEFILDLLDLKEKGCDFGENTDYAISTFKGYIRDANDTETNDRIKKFFPELFGKKKK